MIVRRLCVCQCASPCRVRCGDGSVCSRRVAVIFYPLYQRRKINVNEARMRGTFLYPQGRRRKSTRCPWVRASALVSFT